jgi:hypothetical protein
MSASVDTMVTIWKYPFHFLYLLLRVHDCRTHAGPLSLDNKSASGNMAELIQANHHYAKCQPKDRRPHSYRPIVIRQQGSMRTTGHTQLYIVSVSFIGGGNRRTQRKPPTCRRSLTNFITQFCTPRPERDSNSQHQW